MPPPSSDRAEPAAGEASGDKTSVSTCAWLLRDHRLVLVLVVAVGATLRVVGIGWGLPVRLHADEWVIVEGAVDMARRNSFEPPYFPRPDHLEMMVSNIAYLLYAHRLRGTSVETVHAAEPGALLLISRIVTAVAGTFMIVLAYLIGRRFSLRTGAIAALVFAIFPPFVEHSRFATPDVPLTLALTGVVLSSVRYLESRSWKDACLGSAAVALSISIKYPGALAFAMVLGVLLVSVLRHRYWTRLPAHGALATFAVPAFPFLISPSLFTNFAAVLDAVARESRDSHPGADGFGLWGNLAFYGSTFARGRPRADRRRSMGPVPVRAEAVRACPTPVPRRRVLGCVEHASPASGEVGPADVHHAAPARGVGPRPCARGRGAPWHSPLQRCPTIDVYDLARAETGT